MPRPVKQVSRAACTVRHPVGAAENKAIGAVLYPPRPRPRSKRSHGKVAIGGVIIGLIMLAVLPWWVSVLFILAMIVVPIIARHYARRRPAQQPDIPPWLAPPVACPTPPQWPPVPPVRPSMWQPPIQRPSVHERPRAEPWPANRAFRTPPPNVTSPEPPVRPPTSAGQWELDARRRTGLGDGSRNQ
jgi:hypothetical protein